MIDLVDEPSLFFYYIFLVSSCNLLCGDGVIPTDASHVPLLNRILIIRLLLSRKGLETFKDDL